MKFLIADDEIVTDRMLQRLLSRYGVCDYVMDGKKAVSQYIESREKGDPYELIFMDVIMPEMNGFEALSAIRESESRMGIAKKDAVKIILMTGLGLSRDIFTMYKTSCLEYLYKPLDIDHLIGLLKKHRIIEEIDEKNGYNN